LVYFHTEPALKFISSSKGAAENRVSARLQLYWLLRTKCLPCVDGHVKSGKKKPVYVYGSYQRKVFLTLK